MAQHPVFDIGSELGHAVATCRVALAVWHEPTATVVLVNRPLEELAGRKAEELIGRDLADLLSPRPSVQAAVTALSSGLVDAVRTKREIHRPDGSADAVWVWTRTVEVGDERAGVSIIVPLTGTGACGRDPTSPWRELLRIGVGTTDDQWRIVQVSSEVEDLTGVGAAELVGRPLFELLHVPCPPSLGSGTRVASFDVPARGRLERSGAGAVEVGVLVSPVWSSPAVAVFALLADVGPAPAQAQDRVRELELRLARIAGEVRAAGVLDQVGHMAQTPLPSVSGLTSRQWEILSRLLRGERVPGIAHDLYVSQSTVRNHLAALYRRFGVHSQAELVALLR